VLLHTFLETTTCLQGKKERHRIILLCLSFQFKKRWVEEGKDEETTCYFVRFTCRCTHPGYRKLSKQECNGFFYSVSDCQTTLQRCKREFLKLSHGFILKAAVNSGKMGVCRVVRKRELEYF